MVVVVVVVVVNASYGKLADDEEIKCLLNNGLPVFCPPVLMRDVRGKKSKVTKEVKKQQKNRPSASPSSRVFYVSFSFSL